MNENLNRLLLADRFADMWRRAREDGGKSQEYMAKALGVSKKTVQNWEAGYGCPSQIKGFEWFEAAGVQPIKYYLELIYPEEFRDDSKNIDAAVIECLESLSPLAKAKLIYVLKGGHGSVPHGVLELFNSYLHLPLRDRLPIAQSVISSYEIAEYQGLLLNTEPTPDIALVKMSYSNALEAVKAGKKEYTNF